MYKIAAPISVKSIRDNCFESDLNKYLEYFKKGNIERVFVSLLAGVYTKEADEVTSSQKFKRTVEFFKQNGLEVGIWISAFGHGSPLSHNENQTNRREYKKLTGVKGESFEDGYCPLDDNFTNDYLTLVRRIASYSPDIIMIDDDFRLNFRNYYFGCFCDEHLKYFYNRIGEVIPRDEIEKRIFTGGKNKYRDAYMDMSKKTLLDFAKKVRASVDGVNPKIRVGACMTFGAFDFEGSECVEIAKAFAGDKTKPFTRGAGAPYHESQSVIEAIENERLQASWVKNSNEDVEFFTEGDVYPRPRYNVSSKSLELFDLALYCSGETDGILKYTFDYHQNLDYETGYIDRHIKNSGVQEKVKSLFENKTITGVSVFCAQHKIRNFGLPSELIPEIVYNLLYASKPHSSYILSKNSIPTCYSESEYPVAVLGENARYVEKSQLKNGAIIDVAAAKILTERGIDVGFISAEEITDSMGEYYCDYFDDVLGTNNCHIYRVKCDKNAKISSIILPEKTPGVYLYENAEKLRFFVISASFQFDMSYYYNVNYNYCNNYYRQRQIIDGVEYLCGKKLPATCEKNPNLYILAGRGDKSLAVLMMNIFADDILSPVVTLDKAYKSVKFVNCGGKLCGDKIYLEQIPAYGFASFEVEE